MMDIVKPNLPDYHLSSSNDASNNNNNNNKLQKEANFHLDLKSYFQQLAEANGVKGFSLVSDNALCPRYDMARIAAPSFNTVNGATRKFLAMEEDAAPSYPTRRRSSALLPTKKEEGKRRFSDGDKSTNSNNQMLESVFDQVDHILHEEEEDDDDAHSVDSQEPAVASCTEPSSLDDECNTARFDSNIRRDQSPTQPPKVRTSLLKDQRLPRLPVRQHSVDDFSTALNSSQDSSNLSFASTSSKSSISVSIATGQTWNDHPPVADPLKGVAFATCVPIEETTSWHEEDHDDDEEEEEEEEVNYNDQQEQDDDIPPPPMEDIHTPDAQPWEPKVSPSLDASLSKPTLELDLEQMIDPPPLDLDVAPAMYRRKKRASRRSSLDTGFTFRNSFSSQNSEDEAQAAADDDDHNNNNGEQQKSSRWD